MFRNRLYACVVKCKSVVEKLVYKLLLEFWCFIASIYGCSKCMYKYHTYSPNKWIVDGLLIS